MNSQSLKKILRKQNTALLVGTLLALVVAITSAGVISSLRSYDLKKDQLGERVKSLNNFLAREALIHSFHTLDFELNKMRADFQLQSISFNETATLTNRCAVDSGDLISFPISFGDKDVGCVEARLEPLNLASRLDSSLLVPVGLTAIVMWVLLMAYRRSVTQALISPLQELHTQAEAIGGLKGNFNITTNVTEFKKLESMLNHMLVRVNESTMKLTEYEKEASKVQVARQVAHDIRSPLSALMMLTSNSPELSEPKLLLLRNAVSRINDIANTLRSKAQKTLEPELKVESLAFCIEEIVSEKRPMCDRLGVKLNFDLTRDHFNVFAKVQPSEFKRVISNILNNSIEAIREHGAITVELASNSNDGLATIVVRDTGCGIPSEKISHVFDNGFSFKKPGGSGLGLFHAKEQIKYYGGRINISSIFEVGTTVTIDLPQSTPPPFWCRELSLEAYEKVVVVDDSQSVHDVWRARLTAKIAVESVYDISGLYSALQTGSARTLFLVDYEFNGSNLSGLDVIAKVQGEKLANIVLVTSHAHEIDVVERCRGLGLKLLPKSLIAFVPLGEVTASRRFFKV